MTQLNKSGVSYFSPKLLRFAAWHKHLDSSEHQQKLAWDVLELFTILTAHSKHLVICLKACLHIVVFSDVAIAKFSIVTTVNTILWVYVSAVPKKLRCVHLVEFHFAECITGSYSIPYRSNYTCISKAPGLSAISTKYYSTVCSTHCHSASINSWMPGIS